MTLNDELLAGLGDSGLEQIAGMLGTDTRTARKVIEAVSGTIVGGMARNAEHPDGADALRGALDDHKDADPFNSDVASLTRDGHSILGHVLGGQGTEQAASGLSQMAGVDTGAMMRLLPLVAPMIMSLLADRAASRDMDAGAVADDLSREHSSVSGGLGDLLGALLGGIFGGAVPQQAGPYAADEGSYPADEVPQAGSYAADEVAQTGSYAADEVAQTGSYPADEIPRETQVAPGTSNPDW